MSCLVLCRVKEKYYSGLIVLLVLLHRNAPCNIDLSVIIVTVIVVITVGSPEYSYGDLETLNFVNETSDLDLSHDHRSRSNLQP